MEEFPVHNFAETRTGLGRFVKKAWAFLTGSVFSTATYSAAMVAVPWFLEHIIDAFKARTDPISILDDFLNSPEFYWTLAVGGGYVSFQCVSAMRNYFIKRAAIEVQAHLLPEILKKVVDLTYTENQNLQKGEIEQNLNQLQSNLELFFSSIIQGGSSILELSLAMLVVMIKFEYEFSLYLLGIAGFNIGTLFAVRALTKNLDNAKQKSDKDLASIVHGVVENYENIKVSGKEKYVIESLVSPLFDVWLNHQKRGNTRAEQFSMAKDVLLAIFGTYIIARTVYLLTSTPGRSIDDITYIVIYLRQIISSSSMFDSHLKRGMSSYRILNSAITVLNKNVESLVAQNFQAIDDYDSIQSIMFYSVKYRLGKVVQNDNRVNIEENSADENRPLLTKANEENLECSMLGPVTFLLESGMFTGIAGDSGSGKTVITRLLFRFLNLSEQDGKITLNLKSGLSFDIQQVTLEKFRQQICYTPQSIELFDCDVMKNITLEDDAQVNIESYLKALKMAQLSEKEKNATAEDLRKFSGGQRQRMALARAFYRYLQGCRIFIFDESTSALDAMLQSAIMKEIYKLRDNGCMVFFVAHRLSTIRQADQVLFLSKERAASEERSLMAVQHAEDGLSAFDAMRKKSEKFNALVIAEFGEDLIVNPGKNRHGTYFHKGAVANLITVVSGGRFQRLPVQGDGDCGFTAFGITRKKAYELISNNINAARNILIPLVEEVLCTDSNFINYLPDNFVGIRERYRLYHNALEHRDKVLEEEYEQKLKECAQDLNLLSFYIDYDVRDKHVDAGWAHPLVLFALAEIQKIPLRLWQVNEQGLGVPHHHYAEYRPRGVETEFTDLLFINGNHFERLQKVIGMHRAEDSSVSSSFFRNSINY